MRLIMLKFVKILRVEMEDLEADIELLADEQQRRSQTHAETSRVCRENVATLRNEEFGVRHFITILDGIDVDNFDNLDHLVASIRRLFRDVIEKRELAQASIVLIDPKQGVDYFQFSELPHLSGGLIVEDRKAIERLESLVKEMDDRYKRFRSAKVNNITTYNQKVDDADRIPSIWLIHDEFAEWMMVEDYKKAVSATVQRLGVKARAAGIHLIFAAQRPDATVMPMQLRSNLGNRLILRVDSEGTSEVALGEKGAEKLLGKGHLLAKLEGETSLTYAQVPLASEEFTSDIISTISS